LAAQSTQTARLLFTSATNHAIIAGMWDANTDTISKDVTLEKDVASLIGDIELGFDFFESAGQKLVKFKAKHENFFDFILKEHDWITIEVLTTLEAIGKKELHPRLLLAPKFTLNAFASLPYEEQKYAVENPIAVVDKDRIANRRITDMTRDEVRQVASRNGIRSVAEQKQFIAKQQVIQVTLGKFLLTHMNGKCFTKQASDPSGQTQKIEVDERGEAIVEIIRRK
jgi:hypothetical protein